MDIYIYIQFFIRNFNIAFLEMDRSNSIKTIHSKITQQIWNTHSFQECMNVLCSRPQGTSQQIPKEPTYASRSLY